VRWNLPRVFAAICLFFGVWVLLQFLRAARLGIIAIILGVLVGIALA